VVGVNAAASPTTGATTAAIHAHHTGTFQLDWVAHLGPIYVATIEFVVGALLSLRSMVKRR
jgi:hypothetical protein